MSIQRGEVYEVYPDLSVGQEIEKKRPCVIVSSNIINNSSPLAVVVPYVDVPRKEGGLSKDSLALCDQVKALDQMRIDQKLGNLQADTMSKIDKGLRQVLSLM
jgi:mRNA interferase MazF